MSHAYDEPNILVWTRFNTRRGPNGEKILFIEEIQSDWHQQGREKGYVDSQTRQALDNAIASKKAEIRQIEIEIDSIKPPVDMAKIESVDDIPPLTPAHSKLWDKREVALEELSELRNQRVTAGSGVPDAPFKKTWPDLALKRVIAHAVGEGFDGIAWTTG